MKKETFDRVMADFPLIYAGTSAGAITQYMISLPVGQSASWGMIGQILGLTLFALGVVLAVYAGICYLSKE